MTETQEIVVKTITDTAYPVYMTATEIAAVHGMVMMVDNEKSEVDLTRLKKVLDDLFDEHYPGFYLLTDSDDPIVLHQD